jgi:RNA polymerase sigma factor (sigma-70 family)
MQEARDTELLRQYVRENSEDAFASLIARHVNMVYSAALRKTGNAAAAEEITQAVFVILAKKANQLSRHAALSGWLYQATRLTAANFLRTEIRRNRREQEAFMQSLSNQTEPEVWAQIAPLLEDAMGRLGEKDRNALALRFFEGKSFQEIGNAFGASENAAKKRVTYALEKLRAHFSRRGVNSTAETIAGTISANSVQAAPVALTKSVAAVAIAKGSIATASTIALVKGTMKMMTWLKIKFAIGIGTLALLASGLVTVAFSDGITNTSSPTKKAFNIDSLRVAISSKVFIIPDESIEKLGVAWQPATSGGSMSVLDNSQTNAVMEALQQIVGAESMTLPPTANHNGMAIKFLVTKAFTLTRTNTNVGITLQMTPLYSTSSSTFELNITNELHEAQSATFAASATVKSDQTLVMRQSIKDGRMLDKNIVKPSSLLIFATPSRFNVGTGLHRLN